MSIQTCATCPVTREEPALKRKPLKGPWRCIRCYQRDYKAALGKAGKSMPTGRCTPASVERIAELVRSDIKAARLLAELFGKRALTITFRPLNQF